MEPEIGRLEAALTRPGEDHAKHDALIERHDDMRRRQFGQPICKTRLPSC